jgi:hypothetical protein
MLCRRSLVVLIRHDRDQNETAIQIETLDAHLADFFTSHARIPANGQTADALVRSLRPASTRTGMPRVGQHVTNLVDHIGVDGE